MSTLIDCYGGDIMSGYQRFISYIYAYSLEGKGRNVGFAKVEVRGEQKRIGVSLKGVYGMESMQVAVFWRNGNRVELLPFRTISIHAGTAQAQYILSNDLFREYGRGLEEAAGMIIYSEQEETRAYVTVWDEEEFKLSMMKTMIQEEAYEEEQNLNHPKQEETEKIYQEQLEHQEGQLEEPSEEGTADDLEEKETIPSQLEEAHIELDEEKEDEDIKEQQEVSEQEIQENDTEQQLQAQILHALFKQLKGEEEQEVQEEEKENVFSAAEITENEEKEDHTIKENRELWDSLRKLYPQTKTFPSQEDVECLKIKPGSIGRLPRQNWIFANNNFVLYGYMKYHYLVLIRIGDTYFLGVPGKGDANVRVVANQFGFEQFHPVEGKWGYWCVRVMG